MTEKEKEAIETLVSEFRERLIANHEMMHKTAAEEGSAPLRFRNIAQRVADYFGLDVEKLLSRETRLSEYVRARQIIYWLTREELMNLPYSLNKLGELMGGFNHATILNGLRRFDEDMEYERSFKIDVNNITRPMGFEVVKKGQRFKLQHYERKS